jgi:3-hydroxyisobutyrate dehydrogenase
VEHENQDTAPCFFAHRSSLFYRDADDHREHHMSERIGFIGLGIMGGGMARNLIEKGHALVVWNRTPERAAALADAGAAVADSPAALTRQCDLILVCVSDTPDVVAVTRGPDGILAGLQPGSLVVDHSTISPHVTRELAAEVEAAGGSWIDAPVSGGSEGAARGTLSIMIGGVADDVERARPYLEAFGTSITHVGGIGAGQMVKIVNQILVVGNQLAASEALLFAQAAGLDLEATIEAVKGGAAGSWMLANRGPQMMVRDWRPGFTIDLQQKDLRLALDAADRLGVPLPGTGLVFQMYRALQRRGLGAEGNHALVKALEEMSGITLGEET